MESHGNTAYDQALWDACVRGDAEAFGELFARYHNDIYNFCFRRVASWAVAEDLVSVVFMETWRTRRPLVLESGSVLPWLIGVATKSTHRHRRTMARYQAMLQQIPAESPPPELDDAVVGKIDDERRMAAVLAAIAGLPKREREVIAVCVFGELDYAAAAVALNIPVGTVRSRLSRARKRLANRFPTITAAPCPTE